jgi:hypothetical protein
MYFLSYNQQAVSGTGKFRALVFFVSSDTRYTEKILSKIITKDLTAEIFFTGSGVPGNEKENVPFSLALDILRYILWQCKLNKKIPTIAHVSDKDNYLINDIRTSSKEMSELYEHCTMFTCRNEPAVHGGDGGDADDGHGRG